MLNDVKWCYYVGQFRVSLRTHGFEASDNANPVVCGWSKQTNGDKFPLKDKSVGYANVTFLKENISSMNGPRWSPGVQQAWPDLWLYRESLSPLPPPMCLRTFCPMMIYYPARGGLFCWQEPSQIGLTDLFTEVSMCASPDYAPLFRAKYQTELMATQPAGILPPWRIVKFPIQGLFANGPPFHSVFDQLKVYLEKPGEGSSGIVMMSMLGKVPWEDAEPDTLQKKK